MKTRVIYNLYLLSFGTIYQLMLSKEPAKMFKNIEEIQNESPCIQIA